MRPYGEKNTAGYKLHNPDNCDICNIIPRKYPKKNRKHNKKKARKMNEEEVLSELEDFKVKEPAPETVPSTFPINELKEYRLHVKIDAVGLYYIQAFSEEEAVNKFLEWPGDNSVEFEQYVEEYPNEVISIDEI